MFVQTLHIGQSIHHCQKYSTFMQSMKHPVNTLMHLDHHKNQSNLTQFSCDNGTTLDILLLNDLTFDCQFAGEDEPILIALLNYVFFSHVQNLI